MWLLLCFGCVWALARVDTVEYQVVELDSPVQDSLFCGSEEDIILVLTMKNSVYRSENGGFSWRQLREILVREGRSRSGDLKSIGQVISLQLSPVDKRLVVMLGNKGINWLSDDCGKTIWALNYGKPIYSFQFHPLQRNWGLAASWTVCGVLQRESCALYKELYVTKDLGVSWTLVTGYVVQFTWAQDSLDPYLQRRLPEDRIYVTYIPGASGHQSSEGWTHKVDMVKSDDYFQTTITLVPRGNKFIVSGKYILVVQVVDAESSRVQILVSNERNIEQFYVAELPAKYITDRSFTLLDSSEESLFLHMRPASDTADYGNVYVSDASGRRFALSLLRNLYGDGACDFDKVSGLEGIYLANILANSESEVPLQSKPKSRQKPARETEPRQQTVISFDKGSIWRPLSPPEFDSLGLPIACEDPPCHLHLHSFSSEHFAPVYSTTTAVGLVLGAGNVGTYLSSRMDQVNTYLSRDGGLTWSEVRKGSYIYEIGDHGAIIVLVSDSVATDSIFFSWDEGLTWESLRFSDFPVEVDNIIIEPGAVSQRFLLQGSHGNKGIVVGFDFSSLHEPQCKGADHPGDSGSDYELWSPNDGRAGSKCLMGRTVSYARKRRESACYNGEEFERFTFMESCVCTDDDYECDIGYMRQGSQPCSPIPDFQPSSEMCLPGDEFYEIPTGYRRVAGDTCVRGVSLLYDPLKIPCSTTSFSSSEYTALLAALMLTIVLLLSWQAQRLQSIWQLLTDTQYEKRDEEHESDA